jgi:hypothetical protein
MKLHSKNKAPNASLSVFFVLIGHIRFPFESINLMTLIEPLAFRKFIINIWNIFRIN